MNDYLIKELKKYILNDRVNYAVLIDGEWGSGKTHFIKEELIPSLNNDIVKNNDTPSNKFKKPIYVSLYGVDSLDSISTQIYLSLSEKYSKIFSLGLNAIKVFKPDLGYSDALKILDDKINLNNYVLIFDDLERINMDINMCLAYINSFVEHNKLKVIIIANENEIGKNDFNKNYELKIISTMQENINYNDSEKKDAFGKKIDKTIPDVSTIKERVNRIYEINCNYRLIKEKLIGKTYKYKSDLNMVIDKLMDVYKYDEDYASFLKENKQLLLNKINLYGCSNLRTIKCIFEDFHELYLKLKKADIKFSKDMILKIYINFIVVLVNIKQGNKMLRWDNELKYQTTCFGEDEHQSYHMYFLAFRFVDEYILNRNITVREIENVVNDYINNNEYEFKNTNNAFAKLECYWELEDDELNKLLIDLKKELVKDIYPCSIFPKIVVILSYLENLDFKKDLISEIITVMEEKIEKNLSIRYYMDYNQIIRDDETLKIYNKNIERLKKACKNKNYVANRNSLDIILNDTDWGIKLYEYIHESDNYNYFFNSKAFLSKLNINKIIENIDKSNSKNIYHFKYCIDRIYSFGNIKDYYESDKESFQNLIKGISKLKKEKYGVTKKESLKYLENILTEKYQLL